MSDELVLLTRLAEILNQGQVKYFVTGSVAAMYYGEARLTRDVDVVVHLRYADVSMLAEAMVEPEFYLDRRAIVEAMQIEGSFNAIHNPTGMKVDFMCAELDPYNESRFRRAAFVELIPGVRMWASAPEDVILKKLEFYKQGGSDKHLRDIASMVKISGDTFDRAYLDQWAQTLGVAEEWAVTKRRVGW